MNLNGSGSAKWLIEFLRNPGEKRFYGKQNVLPAFDTELLPERELRLLIVGMRGNGREPGRGPRESRLLLDSLNCSPVH